MIKGEVNVIFSDLTDSLLDFYFSNPDEYKNNINRLQQFLLKYLSDNNYIIFLENEDSIINGCLSEYLPDLLKQLAEVLDEEQKNRVMCCVSKAQTNGIKDINGIELIFSTNEDKSYLVEFILDKKFNESNIKNLIGIGAEDEDYNFLLKLASNGGTTYFNSRLYKNQNRVDLLSSEILIKRILIEGSKIQKHLKSMCTSTKYETLKTLYDTQKISKSDLVQKFLISTIISDYVDSFRLKEISESVINDYCEIIESKFILVDNHEQIYDILETRLLNNKNEFQKRMTLTSDR